MFKKQIKTGSAVDIPEDAPPSEFPKGTKYAMDRKIYHIVEAFTDSSTEWRRTVSDAGEEELVMLSTLKRDLASETIELVKKS